MQNDLDANYPDLDIQILGINAVGRESGNTSVTSGRDIPWLQDVTPDSGSDVWTSWDAGYRDVVILDTANVAIGAMNLSTYDLRDPAAYDALKTIFLDTSSIQTVSGDYNMDGHVDAADYTVWEDNLNLTAAALQGNGSGAATVVQADYQLWKTHFGESIASGSGVASVPEPATLLLALLATASLPLRMRHRLSSSTTR